jgi:hypothetical protein
LQVFGILKLLQIESSFFRTLISGFQFSHLDLKRGDPDIEFSLLSKQPGPASFFFKPLEIVFEVVVAE